MAYDGYRWGYVRFAHFLLYFIILILFSACKCCLKLTDDVCIKGHISPYLEASASNSERLENFTEKVKIIGKFI